MNNPIHYRWILLLLQIFIAHYGVAQGDNKIDTIITIDNNVLTGQISNLNELITADMSIHKREIMIDTSWGKKASLPVKYVKYVKAYGTTFAYVELNSGSDQLVEAIASGKVNLYLWRRIPRMPGTAVVDVYDANKSYTKSNGHLDQNQTQTWFIFVKETMYPLTIPFLKRKFGEFFNDCPKLIQESKNKNFNFEEVQKIVEEYNHCF